MTNQIKIIKKLFIDITKNMGKNINDINDMLSYTSFFILFNNVLLKFLTKKTDLIKINTDKKYYEYFINKLLIKLNITSGSNNKIINKDNIKILIIKKIYYICIIN
jgi:uncharacterized protein (UPF0216 family)